MDGVAHLDVVLGAVAAAILLAALFYLLFIFPTQWLKVERVHHPLGIGKRIVQISDLHVDMLRISPARLLRAIEKAQPDYIFLTGDYTYLESSLPRLELYIDTIQSAGVPVFAVLGNHDHELPRPGRLLALLRERRVTLLRNASLELPDYQLVGIDNYSTGHSRVGEAFRKVKEGKPVIVITHDPNVVVAIRKRYDYLMAGHLHGKQMNVPYFFAFKPKGPLPAQGIYKGLHRDANGVYYISKGIGQAGVNARFMVRSEITVHDL